MGRRGLRRWLRALRYVAVECGAGAVSLCFVVVGIALLPVILVTGGIIAPGVVASLRRWADRARARSARYSGRRVEARYPPIPERPTIGECLATLFSRSTGRDAIWLLLHAVPMFLLGIVFAALPLAAVNALAVTAYWSLAPADDPVSSPYPVTSWAAAAGMPFVAVAYAAISWWLTPWVARAFAWVQSKLLTPGRRALLNERVTALTASRTAALDAHAAELRRIERDLHDGAQNRLVSVVMMLGIAERSLKTGPDGALPLLRRAQDAATDALAGLRTTVHDIYPPILDELGLEGALSAVAGRSAVPCVLRVTGLRRAPTAVEAATYFVVAEAVTNANKHSAGTRISVTVGSELAGSSERIVVVVEDDGHGGAVERPGGGLAGIRRRVQAFEGSMQVQSPMGGPTTMKVELPCGW